MLIPAFHRCPEAGAIVGRIMAGYGELELGLGLVVIAATGRPRDSVLREIFEVRHATPRLNQTRDMGLPHIRELGLEVEYLQTVVAYLSATPTEALDQVLGELASREFSVTILIGEACAAS